MEPYRELGVVVAGNLKWVVFPAPRERTGV